MNKSKDMTPEEREQQIVDQAEYILRLKENGFTLRSVSALTDKIDVPELTKIEVLKILSKHPDTFGIMFDPMKYSEKNGPLFGLTEDIEEMHKQAQEVIGSLMEDDNSPLATMLPPEIRNIIRNITEEKQNHYQNPFSHPENINVHKNNIPGHNSGKKPANIIEILKKIHSEMNVFLQNHGVDLFNENKKYFEKANEIQTNLTSLIIELMSSEKRRQKNNDKKE
jgi:intein-encoded DNA endonuclease-like protein